MKKLSIVAILLVAILALVGCSSIAEHSVRTYTEAPDSTTYYGQFLEQEQEQIEEAAEEDKTENNGAKEEEKELVEYDTQNNKELKGVLKQMLVKIIDEQNIEELANDYIVVDGVVYTNPKNNPNIDIGALGYKQLFIDDFPEYNVEKQKLVRHYYDDGKLIHRAWRVVNLTEEEIQTQKQMREMIGG